jgi:hypothetical protein
MEERNKMTNETEKVFTLRIFTLRIIESPLSPPVRKWRQKQLQRRLARIRTKYALDSCGQVPAGFYTRMGNKNK